MRSSRGTVMAIAVFFVLLMPAGTGAVDPAGPQVAYLQISSDPPGAEVFVDQVRMNGTTPLTVRVPALQHQEVVVNLYGYEAARQTVMLQPGQTLPLPFELVVLPGAGRPETETPGAAGSATAPQGRPEATDTEPGEIWTEDAPLPTSVALLALAGAGLLAARRRR